MTTIDHLNPPTGHMADNVVGFARALRAAGIPVGSGAVIDALNELQAIEIGHRADRTRRPFADASNGRRHAWRAAEIPGRHRAHAGRHAAEGFEGSDERELIARHSGAREA